MLCSSARQFPEDAARLPVFVALLLDDLNPIVGNVHGHAVVETITTILERRCQTRHTADFLSDGDGLRIHLVNQEVGQGEIADGIVVLTAVIIIAVTSESSAQSVVVIEH